MARITKNGLIVHRVERTREAPVRLMRKQSPVKRRMLGDYEKRMELCLCGICVSAFYHLPDHKIRRVEADQYYKDKCDYCGVRSGFDYRIYGRKGA